MYIVAQTNYLANLLLINPIQLGIHQLGWTLSSKPTTLLTPPHQPSSGITRWAGHCHPDQLPCSLLLTNLLQVSPGGLDFVIQTNNLAHFLLTNLFQVLPDGMHFSSRPTTWLTASSPAFFRYYQVGWTLSSRPTTWPTLSSTTFSR